MSETFSVLVDAERVAQMMAHRACCGTEHDPANGKLHGCCVVCGAPWPCDYAGPAPTAREPAKVTEAMVEAALIAVAGSESSHERYFPWKSWEGYNESGKEACREGMRVALKAALATQPAEPGVVQYTFDIPTPSRMTINYSDGKAGLTVFGRVTITIEDELKAQEGGR